ncbi:MFS transporter [Sporofaciens musculi]|jgi:GPH family glycoside/pentoside/hexuronide:cation symporter/probable glucitol transport protein GutA|uniref:MFS transporter n=1 Tax=Sporofaciens musculi TaxID=2681861 RepID=UPI0025700388|nr:glycoside-pentoside-hexuronide (GPH):cation symporter [Sporofaciens musculi]
MNNKVKEVTADVTKSEIFHFGMLGVAQCIMFTLWNGQMMYFYTDIFMLAPMFISGMFLVARVWDGVNDPMIGLLIERTKTRYGRFKNAILFAPVPLAIAMVLNFTVPSFGKTGNLIYAVVTYILFGMIYTTIDVSYFSLPTVMTDKPDRRATMFGIGRLCTGMTMAVTGILIIPCVTMLGKGDMKKGYFYTAILFGVVSCILYLFNVKHVHERTIVDKPKFNFKMTMKAIGQNKPLLMVMIFGFILQLVSVGKTSLNMYYATYNLGNVQLVAIVGLAGVPGMLIGSAVAPLLVKKFEAKYVAVGLNILFFVDSLFLFFFENNAVALFINNLFFLFYCGAGMVLVSTMTAETIEYAELKLGQRNEGFITSTQTFISKLAVAIANSSVLALIAALGYVPNQEQAQGTLKAFFYMESIIPGVIGILACIPMLIYPLTKKEYAKITEELKARRGESA